MVLCLQQEVTELHLHQVVDMELHPPQAVMVPHPLGVDMVHILQVDMAPHLKVVVINPLSKAMDSNQWSRSLLLKLVNFTVLLHLPVYLQLLLLSKSHRNLHHHQTLRKMYLLLRWLPCL